MTSAQRPGVPFDGEETSGLASLGITGDPTRRRPGCPDPALVLALDEGVLDEDLATRVRAHVTGCPACQNAAGDLAKMFDEPVPDESRKRIDAMLAAAIPKPRRGLSFWLVPAGGLALATVVAWMLLATRPAAPLPAPESQIAQGPTALPSVFQIDRPLLPQGDVDLAVRGESTTKPSLENRIAAALDQADTGDVKSALSQLDAIVRDNQRSHVAAIALGSVLLRANRDAEAVIALERARNLGGGIDTRDELDWFTSIAQVRTGNRDRAKTLLEGICQRGGERSPRACAGLAELNRTPSR